VGGDDINDGMVKPCRQHRHSIDNHHSIETTVKASTVSINSLNSIDSKHLQHQQLQQHRQQASTASTA
jgi:hypothetical protein